MANSDGLQFTQYIVCLQIIHRVNHHVCQDLVHVRNVVLNAPLLQRRKGLRLLSSKPEVNRFNSLHDLELPLVVVVLVQIQPVV